jgi:hypothetical protein
MLTTKELDEIVATKRLRRRDDIPEQVWSFWELKNLNMHRVVGHLRATRSYSGPGELEQDLRDAVARHFRRSWWRGMAYGVIVDAVPLESLESVMDVVDMRDNRRGTLQWVILISPDSRAAVAVHTWIEGYLSPVYRSVLERLEEQKVDVSRMTRPKDGIVGLLFDVADLRAAAVSFNVRQGAFREFQDRER